MRDDTNVFNTLLSAVVVAVSAFWIRDFVAAGQAIPAVVMGCALVLHLPVLYHYALDASGETPQFYEAVSWLGFLAVVAYINFRQGDRLFGGLAVGLAGVQVVLLWRVLHE